MSLFECLKLFWWPFCTDHYSKLDRYRRPSESTTPTSPGAPESATSSTQMSTSTNDTAVPESPNLDRPRVKLKTKTLDGSAVEGPWDNQDRVRDHEKNALGLGRGWRGTGKGGVPSWLEGSLS